MSAQLDLRPSPIAGRWYPANPDELAESVDQFLRNAQIPQLSGDVIALVAPHAGHRYSGAVAGHTFAVVQGYQTDLVVVVSPLHAYAHAPLLTTAHAAYSTPLGPVNVDVDVLQELDENLNKRLGFGLTAVRHDQEHSLEIELPFLQRALDGSFHLLPVMIRDIRAEIVHSLGLAIAEVLVGSSALLVASTDLSHFYPQNIAEALDAEVLHLIEALDPQGILSADEEGRGFACGRGALSAVLWAALEMGANKAQILRYATSGDVTGDYSQVVGYAAAAIMRDTQSASPTSGDIPLDG